MYLSGVETDKVPKDRNHNDFWKQGGPVESDGKAMLRPLSTILARRTGVGIIRWTGYEVGVQNEPSRL